MGLRMWGEQSSQPDENVEPIVAANAPVSVAKLERTHWWNAAGKRALNRHDLAQRFLNTLKDIEAQLGGGQGQSLDRQVARVLGEPMLEGMVERGARELGYFSHVPGR